MTRASENLYLIIDATKLNENDPVDKEFLDFFRKANTFGANVIETK